MKSFSSTQKKFKYEFLLDGEVVSITPNLSAKVIITAETIGDSETFNSPNMNYVLNNIFGTKENKEMFMQKLQMQDIIELMQDIINTAIAKEEAPK